MSPRRDGTGSREPRVLPLDRSCLRIRGPDTEPLRLPEAQWDLGHAWLTVAVSQGGEPRKHAMAGRCLDAGWKGPESPSRDLASSAARDHSLRQTEDPPSLTFCVFKHRSRCFHRLLFQHRVRRIWFFSERVENRLSVFCEWGSPVSSPRGRRGRGSLCRCGEGSC